MKNKTIQLYIKRTAGLLAMVLTAGTITAYAGIGTVPLMPVSMVSGYEGYDTHEEVLVKKTSVPQPGSQNLPVLSIQDVSETSVQNPGLTGTEAASQPLSPAQDAGVAAGQISGQTFGQSSGQASGPSVDMSYLGGAELRLLAPATGSQNLSCVIQSKSGSVIVVDGGLKEDADHLLETIQAKGGRVSAWLITHPHSDHIGALTDILNRNPIPIEIDGIYYNFLERDTYERGENMGRMADYDNLLAAFANVPAQKLHTPLEKGQTIQVDEITIHVMNLPFRSLSNTFNNSSVAYRLDVNGKRILFLGDMGWDAGQNLLAKSKTEDLKADVVQMAHHGQDGVEEGLYRVIRPEICLWPTPEWLWDNNKDGQKGDGPWKTLTVRAWMEALGVQNNLCIKDGDQILR